MPFNVPDSEKPAFNKKVKGSLELLAGDVDNTLAKIEMLQPDTLVEEYQKPIEPQVVERLTPLEEEVYKPIQAGTPIAEGETISAEPIQQDSVSLQPEQERVAPIVREYQAPMREDIMSVSPYQQAVTDATSAQVDSLRNEAGELPKSAVDVFSKPFTKDSIKALGMVDNDGNPTDKGELFYNLSKAGMFDQSGVLTKKGQAYLTPISEMSKPEWFNQPNSKEVFDTLWNDGVIRSSSTFAENAGLVMDLVGTAIYGGAQLAKVQALNLAHSSRTWSGQLKTDDVQGKNLQAELATSDLAVSENLYKNIIGLSNVANVALADDRKFIEESILSPVIGAVGKLTGIDNLKEYALDLDNPEVKSAEDALVTARYKQWATEQRLADLEIGEIAETTLGLEGSLKRAEEAKAQLGSDQFNKLYKGVGAFTSITLDPLNMVPAKIAFNMARGAPLANRLQITAQRTMGKISQMELAISKGEVALQSSRAALAKESSTINLAQRLAVDFAERAKQQPELLEKSARASQIASRVTNEASQMRSALPAITSELESLIAKRNSLSTRIPEAYAQKTLQTMEMGRQVRSMPAKAVGATLERVGDALTRTDNAVTNFLQERGLDQMYTAAVGAAGVAGLAGSPIIGTIAAGAAALKAGKVLSSYGKLFRYVGKEMENVRGQIPFWKRVASHTAPNSFGRGIAHTFNMLDLGGVTSDVLRRTGRGIAAAAPTDLMFEYLSDGADMRPETLYQAAAESLVIGGSFAAAGGAFMGTERRMRELSNGDQLNFRRDLVDDRQKSLFDKIPSGTRRAISTYAIANPTLNYQFKDSGASQYDPNTNTATINVKSSNPIKALVAHETLHHTIIKNNMESGISALFLGDMKGNTVGGLFRSRDGKLDPNFEAFKDAYYKRLGIAEMSNAERDAIYPLDKVAVEYFIEKHSDQYSAMAESGELGAIAASGAAKRKLGSILETVLPRIPVLRDLHFKSGGMIDKNGSWVTGNGILDAEGVKTDPITNKMFRDMNRRSAGLAPGQFEPLISDKPDSGASIILNPSDSIDSELLHPLVKTDESGKPILDGGKPVALDKATELERALAGLTVNEVLRRKRSENYAPEKGEAFIDDNDAFQAGWLPDDAVSEMFAKNRFNPEQKRIIREMNRLVKKGTGDRVVMINFPATTRNKSGKAVYKPQGATLRDTVPVAILTSKDGNLLFGLMSVTKLQENIHKRSQSARGKKLYGGNVDLILRDTQAMMDFHKSGTDSIEYFSQKYGAVEADQRKKFINTMFGLLNQKEQAVLNPMLLEDGVKSRDNVYRTYRADRVSKAVPMAPEDYPAMPFSYKATSQVLLPEQARQMPEPTPDKAVDPFSLAPPNAIDKKRIGEVQKMSEKMESDGWTGRPLLVINDEAITGSHRIAAARKAQIDIPVIEISDETGNQINNWLKTNPENTWSVDLPNFLRQGDEEKLHDLKRAKEDGVQNLENAILLMEDEIRINNADMSQNKTTEQASKISEAEGEPVRVVGKSNELTVQGTPAPKTSVKTIPLSGKTIKWDDELKTGVRYMPEYKPSAFPVITPEILASIEKETPTLAAIHIDRMRVGNYMGVDLQGGMYYPAITENLEKQVLWAFNSKGVARTVAARAAENGGYVKLILMQEGNVVGNKTFNDIWFEVLNRSIKANKISKEEALSKLNEMRERVYKKLSSKDSKRNPWILDHSKEWESISEASEAIRSMPQIERGSTYFQKTKVMTKSAGEKMSYQALLSKKMTKAGFPNAEEIVENIEEPAFKGVPSGSAVAILKFNPLEEGADIMTAKDAGVTEHRSYGYVLHGVPVAKINHYQVVDRTFPSTKNQIMTQQHTNFPVRKSIPSESLSHGTIKYVPEKSKAKIKSSAASISSVAKMK